MKYKILRIDGDYDFHNNSTITELPEGAIALTNEEWENKLQPNSDLVFASAKRSKLSQCKSYLLSTDWYVIRKADNGTAIPTQIAENRELARTLQDDINACSTIEELNAINIEF